jgi:hypothetical protein
MILGKTLSSLKEKGYNLMFRREATCLYCIELDWWITPDSFIVDKQYHLGDVNPDGERTVYAISTMKGLKGFLVDTCFVYEDNISLEMQQKLQEQDYIFAEAI